MDFPCFPGAYRVSLPFSLLLPVVNHLLAADSEASRHLAAQAGKRIRVNAGAGQLDWQIDGEGRFSAWRSARIAEGEPEQPAFHPDVTLTFDLTALPLLLQNPDRAMSHVHIAGDAELANMLARLVRTVRWDAEADLAAVIGDIAAVRMVAASRAGWQAVADGFRRFAGSTAEFLTIEQPVLTAVPEGDQFRRAVMTLRDDIERFEKRFSRLQARAGAMSS